MFIPQRSSYAAPNFMVPGRSMRQCSAMTRVDQTTNGSLLSTGCVSVVIQPLRLRRHRRFRQKRLS